MSRPLRHAWLQKHGSPAATRGEFHWYPADGDRDLRSSLVERSRGLEPPGVLWELAPGRVSWAQAFAATAPTDGRRYVGLVLTIAEHAPAAPGELLEALDLPAAAPWQDRAPPADRPQREEAAGAVRAIARALLSSGSARVADPTSHELPRLVASLERALPAAVLATTRTGAWRAGPAADATDPVAELFAIAARDPASRSARAWTLMCELAAARQQSVDEIHAALATGGAPPVLTDEERAAIGPSPEFTTVLHLWGRGRLDTNASSSTLATRLADGVALRALACMIGGEDPATAIAEARWHALLPSDRRTALLEIVARRTASLRDFVERTHA